MSRPAVAQEPTPDLVAHKQFSDGTESQQPSLNKILEEEV